MRASACLLLALSATSIPVCAQREPVIGLPCEGCEAVFHGIPAQIGAHGRIAPESEPGTPMTVTGRVLNPADEPQPGIVVYAYQTDSKGIYPEAPDVRDFEARRHGRLRGWVKSDGRGRYTFDTVRPGSYPKSDLPEHIHFHVIEPGCATYYIDDIMFTDDPKLTPKQIRRIEKSRGGNGIVTPVDKDGVLHVSRDIYLGLNIPGYRPCKT